MAFIVRAVFPALAMALSLARAGAAEQGADPYVDGSRPFILIKDVHREAEAWAMCSAAYDVMSDILSESAPAQSAQLRDLRNGAAAATTMAIVADGLREDLSADSFSALWAMAQLSGTELPRTRRTMLEADAEGIDTDLFLNRMTATIRVCSGNLDGQQSYIDAWRDISKSGLLKLDNQ